MLNGCHYESSRKSQMTGFRNRAGAESNTLKNGQRLTQTSYRLTNHTIWQLRMLERGGDLVFHPGNLLAKVEL